jgi:hypothetical protein
MRTSPLLSMTVIAVAPSLLAADQDAMKRARAISKDAYEAIYQHPYETNILEIRGADPRWRVPSRSFLRFAQLRARHSRPGSPSCTAGHSARQQAR